MKNVHLVMPTPKDQMVKNSWWSWLFHKPHRGVAQRNAALTWLKKKHKAYSKNGCDGVVYFADDDNHYDVQLFELVSTLKIVHAQQTTKIAVVKNHFHVERDPLKFVFVVM